MKTIFNMRFLSKKTGISYKKLLNWGDARKTDIEKKEIEKAIKKESKSLIGRDCIFVDSSEHPTDNE